MALSKKDMQELGDVIEKAIRKAVGVGRREADTMANLKPCRCGTNSYPVSPCYTFGEDGISSWRIFCPTCGATTELSTGYGAAAIEWNRMQSERKNENYDDAEIWPACSDH